MDTIKSIPWRRNRNWQFLIFNLLFVLAFFGPLRDLMRTSWHSEYYTYIPFIPVISAYLIYDNRAKIFAWREHALAPGLLVIVAGILLLVFAGSRRALLDRNDYLSIAACSLIVIWTGGFALVHGVRSLREALFPLLFLLFAVPVPNAAREWIIFQLQSGSTELSYWFLRSTGMPIARDGFVFYLPTMNVEVAPQCSGIRSSLSLVITGVLAAYFFLRTGWARALLMLSLVPIAIIKNAVRIATLSLLGVYVDPSIIESDLHRKGGFVFFALALVSAGGVILVLRKMESRKTSTKAE